MFIRINLIYLSLLFLVTLRAADLSKFQLVNLTNFEENKGQVKGYDGSDHQEVKYFYRKGNLKVFLLKQGISYQFEKNNYARVANAGLNRLKDSTDSLTNIESYRMNMELIGANPNAEILTEGQSQDYTNYYNQDALDVHSYKKIIYKNIYKDIDWVIYITDKNELKYDFIVYPGADYKAIRMRYSHAEQIVEDKKGNIIIQNRMGDIVENKPIVLQNNKKLDSKFILEENEIRFKITRNDPAQVLTIDPKIEWSTYYGGSGSDEFRSMGIDRSGNIYAAGMTNSNSNISYNGFQNNFATGTGIYIFMLKLTSQGSRLWGSYYGPFTSEPIIRVDPSIAQVYLYGRATASATNLSQKASQSTYGGGTNDAFLSKFDSSGSRIWSTYVGGSGTETTSDMQIDSSHQIYVLGKTSSDTNIALNGFQDSFIRLNTSTTNNYIVKFDSSGQKLWGTYCGISGSFIFKSPLAQINRKNQLCLIFPANDSNYITFQNGSDTCWTKWASKLVHLRVDPSGHKIYCRCAKGSSRLQFMDYKLDIDDIGYLLMQTVDTGWGKNSYQINLAGQDDALLFKFDTSYNIVWASYYGGTNSELEGRLTIDKKNQIYFCGVTGSSTGIAHRGWMSTPKGGYVAKFSSTGQRIWGSYWGGVGYAIGIHDDRLVLAGGTNSTTGMALSGHQSSYGGGALDGFVTVLSCNRDTTLYDTICRGDSLVFNGIPRTQSGVYLDTLETWDICDSFITMNLTVSRRDTTHLYDTICFGGSKLWDGVQVSSTGVYLDTLMNSENCDSFLIFHLYIRALDSTRIYDTSCGNTPRTWNGMNLTTAGIYLDTLQNRYGCDSYLYYQYVPKMASSSSPIVSICKGSSYTVGSKTYASSGTFRDTLKNYQGCDSFVTLSLTVRDTSFTIWTASICQGSYYLFQGDTLRTAGVYRDTLKNRNGCDSTLQVSLSVNSLGSKTIYDTICPDKSYAFAGKLLTSSGSYRDSLKTKKGCDSILTLNLFVRPKKPLSLIDSIYRLNATTGFSSYKWYRNSLPLSAPNLNYFFPSESGSFKVEVTEKNGCKYFSDSVQVVKAGVQSASSALNIEIFPNPAKDHLYIQSTTALDRELSIEIYTIDGRRLALPMQRISNLLYSISTASLSAGVYTIELKNAERTETRIFVVE